MVKNMKINLGDEIMNLANKITLVRIFLVPIFMLFLAPIPNWIISKNALLNTVNHYGLEIATVIFIIAAITDKLDGYIARKYNEVTKFGSLVDPLAVTSLRVTAAYNKKVLAADKYGKMKLVSQVIAIPLCLLNNYPINLITHFPLGGIMMLLAVLITIFSGINYFIKNREVFYECGKFSI